MDDLMAIINRLRALRFEVIVSTEAKRDTAIVSIPSTALEYHNPHYAHQVGWSEAEALVSQRGQDILADIQAVCDVAAKAIENS